MNDSVEIVTVDAANIDEHGFFCYKSKPKSAGYRQKRDWLEQRFAEGLRIQILYEDGRSVGFVEYMPGETAWRAVRAPGYAVIHCLWVVGRAKNKGYGSRLLDRCVEDAQQMSQHGVAMVTSSRVWLANNKILLKNGFEVVSQDQAPPSFELLVKRFDDAPAPAFPTDWDERARRYGAGLTVIRSGQCPYIEDAVKDVLEAANERGLEARVVELTTGRDVQDAAPSPYGTFGIVYDGQVLSYHYLLKKDLLKLLDEHPGA
ncbi:MAG: GNAT family N-acetyltransferase [Chloroflexi bacterium]|nr:GNAT family N-acetyltransferase [Chloroflexota bacterium]MBU1751776.1 GNAT family N-acetyltransferase [Chloroflexota bacterium]